MPIPVRRSLTSEQQQFKAMIEEFPEIAKFWDWDTRDYDRQGLMKAMMSRLSGGEVIMSSFFVALWRQDYQALFDIVGAGKYLDQRNRNIIADWLREPFFP